MRTTLTLDDEIAERIADLARERKISFKAVVNETLRRGLADATAPEPEFRLQPHACQMREGIDPRRLNELAWELDDLKLPS